MAKENKTVNIVEKPFVQSLKVELTNDELLQAGSDLARNLDCQREIEEEKKAFTDNCKAQLTGFEAEATLLQAKVRDKSEYRRVDCMEIHNRKETKVTKVRLDTGEELEKRDMNFDERQMKMFETEEPKKP